MTYPSFGFYNLTSKFRLNDGAAVAFQASLEDVHDLYSTFGKAISTTDFHSCNGTVADFTSCIEHGILSMNLQDLDPAQLLTILSSNSPSDEPQAPLIAPFRIKQELEAHGFYSDDLSAVDSNAPIDTLAQDFDFTYDPDTSTSCADSTPTSTHEKRIWSVITDIGCDNLESIHLVFDPGGSSALSVMPSKYDAAVVHSGDGPILTSEDFSYQPEKILELRGLSSEVRQSYLRAITQELRGCADKSVWTLSVLPLDRKAIPTRLVLNVVDRKSSFELSIFKMNLQDFDASQLVAVLSCKSLVDESLVSLLASPYLIPELKENESFYFARDAKFFKTAASMYDRIC